MEGKLTGFPVKMLIMLITIMIVSWHIKFDISTILTGLHNLPLIVGEALSIEPSLIMVALEVTLRTVEMAFLATVVGVAISLPMSLFASRNVFPAYINIPIRAILAFIRTIPSLLWALMFVVIVGLGSTSGILALSFYSIGYLGKLYYEIIEATDMEPYEALLAIGSSKVKLIRYVIVPQSAPYLLSQSLFMFEYNVRTATILGFVGAGGVGFYIINYLKALQYGKAFTFIIIVLATVALIDLISFLIRRKYIATYVQA